MTAWTRTHPYRNGRSLLSSSSKINIELTSFLLRRALPAWTSSNILAGSDTTAIFLRTLFKNLLDYPESLRRLREELYGAESAGRLSSPVTWKESKELPYLDACIKEAGRIHPPFGLPLERVVPAGGQTICGRFLKGGTIVGVSGWVVHRDREIFGQDADVWRPERWLVEDEERRKKMEHAYFTVRSAQHLGLSACTYPSD